MVLKKMIVMVAACLVMCLLAGQTWAGQLLYTKYNIHAFENRNDMKASYANWTDTNGHVLIPANTPITTSSWKKGFIINLKKGGRKIYFEFDKRRMKMSVAEYIKRITSPKPVSLDGFSEVDKKGIREGRALVGMTKDGVMTALGYPATHRTPSLTDNQWTYWRNRFRTLVVEFDDKGIVKNIRK